MGEILDEKGHKDAPHGHGANGSLVLQLARTPALEEQFGVRHELAGSTSDQHHLRRRKTRKRRTLRTWT